MLARVFLDFLLIVSGVLAFTLSSNPSDPLIETAVRGGSIPTFSALIVALWTGRWPYFSSFLVSISTGAIVMVGVTQVHAFPHPWEWVAGCTIVGLMSPFWIERTNALRNAAGAFLVALSMPLFPMRGLELTLAMSASLSVAPLLFNFRSTTSFRPVRFKQTNLSATTQPEATDEPPPTPPPPKGEKSIVLVLQSLTTQTTVEVSENFQGSRINLRVVDAGRDHVAIENKGALAIRLFNNQEPTTEISPNKSSFVIPGTLLVAGTESWRVLKAGTLLSTSGKMPVRPTHPSKPESISKPQNSPGVPEYLPLEYFDE